MIRSGMTMPAVAGVPLGERDRPRSRPSRSAAGEPSSTHDRHVVDAAGQLVAGCRRARRPPAPRTARAATSTTDRRCGHGASVHLVVPTPWPSPTLLDGLNDAQRRAVTIAGAPALHPRRRPARARPGCSPGASPAGSPTGRRRRPPRPRPHLHPQGRRRAAATGSARSACATRSPPARSTPSPTPSCGGGGPTAATTPPTLLDRKVGLRAPGSSPRAAAAVAPLDVGGRDRVGQGPPGRAPTTTRPRPPRPAAGRPLGAAARWPRLYARYEDEKRQRRHGRLRRPAAGCAPRPLETDAELRRRPALAVPPPVRRRVPGRQPAPARGCSRPGGATGSDLCVVGDPNQAIYALERRRPRLPRRLRRPLPRRRGRRASTTTTGRRPQILAVGQRRARPGGAPATPHRRGHRGRRARAGPRSSATPPSTTRPGPSPGAVRDRHGPGVAVVAPGRAGPHQRPGPAARGGARGRRRPPPGPGRGRRSSTSPRCGTRARTHAAARAPLATLRWPASTPTSVDRRRPRPRASAARRRSELRRRLARRATLRLDPRRHRAGASRRGWRATLRGDERRRPPATPSSSPRSTPPRASSGRSCYVAGLEDGLVPIGHARTPAAAGRGAPAALRRRHPGRGRAALLVGRAAHASGGRPPSGGSPRGSPAWPSASATAPTTARRPARQWRRRPGRAAGRAGGRAAAPEAPEPLAALHAWRAERARAARAEPASSSTTTCWRRSRPGCRRRRTSWWPSPASARCRRPGWATTCSPPCTRPRRPTLRGGRCTSRSTSVFAAGGGRRDPRLRRPPSCTTTSAGCRSSSTPDVLDQRVDGDLVRQRIRYAFVGDLSPAVTAVVDPDKLTWVEQSEPRPGRPPGPVPPGPRPLRRPAAVVGHVRHHRPHQRGQRPHRDGLAQGPGALVGGRSSGPSCRAWRSTWPRRSPWSTSTSPTTHSDVSG